MSERIKLRVKFSKHGPIRFIGHLDVMRFFQKAIRRAEIDIAYSSGYSPHQIMSFASPLSVGLESDGEYMDIELCSITNCEDIKRRLNEASVPGIQILSVKILPEKAGNAMASVAAASYEVYFREGREPKCDIEKILGPFLSQEQITYSKETKKGVRELNLKDGIYSMQWDKDHFMMTLDASSAGNIKPIQILETLLAQNNEELKENALLITRKETYINIGEGENIHLAPLDAVGFDTREELLAHESGLK